MKLSLVGFEFGLDLEVMRSLCLLKNKLFQSCIKRVNTIIILLKLFSCNTLNCIFFESFRQSAKLIENLPLIEIS